MYAVEVIISNSQLLEFAIVGEDDSFSTTINREWVQGEPAMLAEIVDTLRDLENGISIEELDSKIEEFLKEEDDCFLVTTNPEIAKMFPYCTVLDIRSYFWQKKKDGLQLPSLKLCAKRCGFDAEPGSALQNAKIVISTFHGCSARTIRNPITKELPTIPFLKFNNFFKNFHHDTPDMKSLKSEPSVKFSAR